MLLGVAGGRGVDAGAFRLAASLQVGQTHCPESLPGQRFEAWPRTVQQVTLDVNGAATVRGDLSDGACVNLGWAASSQTACFPANLNDGFEGNHVYFALDAPLPPHMRLQIDPGPGVRVYAYSIGVDSYYVPPYVPTTVQCEYSVGLGDPVSLNTVANPYGIFFAVAGAADQVEGAFEVTLQAVPE